jgi:anti-sigma factor RsiW
MNCRSAESLLSAFLDDELSQAERRHFEAHLLGCRRCTQSLRELKSAMALVGDAAARSVVAPSPHFDNDLFARIRSGEAMRPSVIEWLQGFLMPERLRPAFLVGATACAVFVAVVLFQDSSKKAGETPMLATGTSEVATPGAATPAAAESTPGASAAVPVTGEALASLPTPQDGPSPARNPIPATRDASPNALRLASDADGNGIIEIADRVVPAAAGLDSTIPNPGAQFVDEYVTDQFFLQRGRVVGDPQPSLVPVSGQNAGDVYIEF